MRITQNSMNRTQMAGLNDSLGRLQRTQEMLTSGKRLVRPSDSPVDTVSAMRLRDQQRSLSTLGESISDGLSRLQASDDALTRSYTMLNRARTLVVSGANGVYSQSERNAFAQEIKQIRSGMTQLANTQYAGQPLFGGTTTNENAFDPNTGEFIGNDNEVWRKVTEATGEAGDINVAVSGKNAFADTTPASGTSKTSIFETDGLLDRISTELTQADGLFDQSKLSAMLTELDEAQNNLSIAASTVGARTNRLAGLQDLNGRLDDGAKVALSKVEDTDFIKAAMDLNIQSNAYNAALQASAKIIQPSLMDFLR